MKIYTYSKLLKGLTLSLGILEDKIQKARKAGDLDSAKVYTREYNGLLEDFYRMSLARQVCGDPIVLIR